MIIILDLSTFQYWFEWRHKCRKKAANSRRFRSGPDGGTNRCIPLNDLEVRVLELSGKGSVATADSPSNQLDDFLADDSDSEPLENLKVRSTPAIEIVRPSVITAARLPIGNKYFMNIKLSLEEIINKINRFSIWTGMVKLLIFFCIFRS